MFYFVFGPVLYFIKFILLHGCVWYFIVKKSYYIRVRGCANALYLRRRCLLILAFHFCGHGDWFLELEL